MNWSFDVQQRLKIRGLRSLRVGLPVVMYGGLIFRVLVDVSALYSRGEYRSSVLKCIPPSVALRF